MIAELSQGRRVLPLTTGERAKLKSVAAAMKNDDQQRMENVCTFKAPAENKLTQRTVKIDYGWSTPPEKTERGMEAGLPLPRVPESGALVR